LIKWQHKTSQRKKRFKSVPPARKIMAAAISGDTGAILGNFLTKRPIVKPDCYSETLKHFNVHLCPIFLARKVSEVWLLHDNARLHTSVCTTQAITKFR
jgi:hypothetical protein